MKDFYFKWIGLSILLSISVAVNGQYMNELKKSWDVWINVFNAEMTDSSLLATYTDGAGIDYGQGFDNSKAHVYSSALMLKKLAGNINSIEEIASDKGNDGHIMQISRIDFEKGDYICLTG